MVVSNLSSKLSDLPDQIRQRRGAVIRNYGLRVHCEYVNAIKYSMIRLVGRGGVGAELWATERG